MELQILKTELNLGLEKEVHLLHVTDSHISKAYNNEDPELVRIALERAKEFDCGVAGSAEDLYNQAYEYAKKNNLVMVHTGDLIDFITEANLDYLEHAFDGLDHLYAAGNHDFCHCLGKAKEDWMYKRETMKLTAPRLKDNMTFSSKVVGGVNLVALDNSYYNISDGQIEMLRAEVAKGLPILLFMHVPLYVPEYAKYVMGLVEFAYMVAAPREILEGYNDARFFQQAPNEQTLRAVDYILGEPSIKAIFVGHTHQNGEEALSNGVMQHITGASYKGHAREIIIK